MMKHAVAIFLVMLFVISISSADLVSGGGDIYSGEQCFNVTATSISGVLSNYPILINISNATGVSSSTILYTNGSTNLAWNDVNFTGYDTDIGLNNWRENNTQTTTTSFWWVRVPTIETSPGTKVCVFFNNSSASSENIGFSGINTFTAFDDFLGSSLNATMWSNTANTAVGSGVLTVGSGGTGNPYTAITYNVNKTFRGRVAFQNGDLTTQVGGFMSSALNAGAIWNGISGGANFLQGANYNSGSNTKGTNIGTGRGYQVYDIYRNGTTNAKFLENGTFSEAISTNLHTGSVPVLFYAPTSAQVLSDWIFVRDYNWNEPYFSNPASIPPVLPPVLFNQQDIYMEGQYITTFHVIDSYSAPLSNVSITIGSTTITTDGLGNANYTAAHGVYSATFVKESYVTKSQSFVVDDDQTLQIIMTSSTPSPTSIDIQGTPKDVKFHITSFWGEPIQNANVTIQGISTTTGSWDWVATLLSIDLAETPIQNTSMSGLTDTNGDAVFLMLASLKYNITVSKAGYTFPLTYISPQASQYPISANMNESWFSSGNDTLKEVNVSVSWVAKDATHAFINITYQDDTGTTTGGDVKVYQRSAGRAVNASPIAVMNVTASSCSNSTVVEVPTGGASYVVDVNATTSTGTNIKRTFAHDFKGQPVNLPGFTPETQLWLAMFILIFTAAFAGVLHAPQISIVLCVELWAFWAIRWFDHLIDGNGYTEAVLVTMFILATFAAFVWNITEGKSKGKRSS